jgi:hypothetical protein
LAEDMSFGFLGSDEGQQASTDSIDEKEICDICEICGSIRSAEDMSSRGPVGFRNRALACASG